MKNRDKLPLLLVLVNSFYLEEIVTLPCITKNTLVMTSSSFYACALDFWNDRMLPRKTEMARETPSVALAK